MEEKELLKIANENGYDSINKIKNWEGYEVYEMYTEDAKLGMFTALLVKNGNTLKKELDVTNGEALLIDDRNNLLAIADVEKKNEFVYIKPYKVLI